MRDARLHHARHTAATMPLVLKVPLPAVMDIMGWSDASIAKRYMHVPRELVTAIAAEVGSLMWSETVQATRRTIRREQRPRATIRERLGWEGGFWGNRPRSCHGSLMTGVRAPMAGYREQASNRA